MVRDNDLRFAWGVIYLHTMRSEACCNCLQRFSDFVEQLVWRVCEDSDGKIIKKGRNREPVEILCWLLVKGMWLAKRNVGP